MKHTLFLSKCILKDKVGVVILIHILISTFSLSAQIGPIGPINPPSNGITILNSSNKGMVNHFHKDSRGGGEDFYFSSGSGNWRNRVQFRIHTNGTVSTTSGMYTDHGNLYLVADWDNSHNNEDIIFGFDSYQINNVKEKMRLTDEGRLGIGTVNPKGMLHIKHTSPSYDGAGFILENHTSSSTYNIINSNNNLFIGYNNNPNANYPQSSYKDRFYIKSNGNIGIGTINPKGKLHVNGDTYTSGKLYVDNNTYVKGNVSLFANEGENQSGTAYLQAKDKSGNSNIGFQFRTQKAGNFINTLKINPNGNVGIGTTEPTEKLEIQGNIKISDGNNILLQKGTLSDQEGLYLIGDRDNTSENEDIIFGFDGNSRESIQEKMRLTDEGYLGIGTNVPTEKLEVLGKIKASSFVTSLQSFPDYVFEKDYKLQPLIEVKKYVEAHHHLPGMPSENNVLKNGLDIKDISVKSVEKIEELFLYVIQQQEIIQNLKQRIEQLEKP
ncbi:hypothetical protein AWE51_04860 [Aquimarina aggregata]|uniref:Peptidase S74 domain-containing protein n=1 Tax=Aquimarina aggregata TaxID=1642818 RepID=A0A163A5W1_9FLAO|nr:hypothetical protein [Aquimarina aggregata]KZS40289.1 hypothetical protein AWE51_04860 [Aquimarina aggregata]